MRFRYTESICSVAKDDFKITMINVLKNYGKTCSRYNQEVLRISMEIWISKNSQMDILKPKSCNVISEIKKAIDKLNSDWNGKYSPGELKDWLI